MPAFDLDVFTLVDYYIKSLPINEYIPIEILEKVYAKEVILAIDLCTESLDRHINIIYDTLIIENKIPESQLLIIGNSESLYAKVLKKALETNKEPCLFEYFHYYENMAHLMLLQELSQSYVSPLQNTDFKKKYITFNGQWRYPRVALITLLESYNLLDLGYCSFAKPYNYGKPIPKLNNDIELSKKHHAQAHEVIYHDTLKIAKSFTSLEGFLWFNACPNDTLDDLWQVWMEETKLKFNDNIIHEQFNKGYDVYKKFPLKIDNTKYQRRLDHPYNSIVPIGSYMNIAHYYYKSYFSIVANTLYFNHQCVHIDEKIMKPISFKHPFVLLSTPYTLKQLKKRGYKTFYPYIDESYDEEVDDNKRLLMVMKEIKRLCNLNENELKEFREGLLDIVDYNYNMLYERTNFVKNIS